MHGLLPKFAPASQRSSLWHTSYPSMSVYTNMKVEASLTIAGFNLG